MPVEEAILQSGAEAVPASPFRIETFLATEETKDLLRFSTAGSVDDGKSTLIGRLLYDSRNVYEDQLRSVSGTQSGQRQPTIDFALLTDGLRAEREQGITIDVAYRFFATQRRKFIVADTPGHEQYTRNMATGASTADLAIILIDARKGILPQSRRHAFIASLLGTRHLVAAINKMDLVDFSEDVYQTISRDFAALVQQYGGAQPVAIPVSALDGDNVVDRSARTPWYSGPTLLEHLESVPVWSALATQPFRMPVQRVIRPDQNYRGFAGQIASGTIRRGDTIVVQPSARTSRVASITTFDGDLEEASAPLSIALTLDDELDISRGDVLSEAAQQPIVSQGIEASIVWFDAQRLETHRPYLLKHGSSTRQAQVTRVVHRTNTQTLDEEAVSSLGMNDIGLVELALTRSIIFDAYSQSRAMGSFILIDPQTNATLAAGMVRRSISSTPDKQLHAGAVVIFGAASQLPAGVMQALGAAGMEAVQTLITSENTLRGLLALGLVVLLSGAPDAATVDALRDFEIIEAENVSTADDITVALLGRREASRA